MLREAKTQCDHLICAIQVDPSIDREDKNKPVQTLVERYIQLSAVSYVDEIIPYQTEQDLEDILNTFHIDIRIIGEEYKHGTFTGRAICAKRGIEIYFNKREHRFSTSDLRKRVNDMYLSVLFKQFKIYLFIINITFNLINEEKVKHQII